jgi:hypothetical protein
VSKKSKKETQKIVVISAEKVDKTNAHYYDGELLCDDYDNKDMVAILALIANIPSEEKKENVSEFIFNLTTSSLVKDMPEKNSTALSYLNKMVNDWGGSLNYDATNNISSEDVLYICASEWRNLFLAKSELIKDFAKNFFIQCADIQSGSCPQGRVIRLWQVAASYAKWFSV